MRRFGILVANSAESRYLQPVINTECRNQVHYADCRYAECHNYVTSLFWLSSVLSVSICKPSSVAIKSILLSVTITFIKLCLAIMACINAECQYIQGVTNAECHNQAYRAECCNAERHKAVFCYSGCH